MIRNLLVISYRNLIRHKVFSFINIIGLALGIAAYFLLLQYISFEISYDRQHANAENIYRLRHDVYKNGAFENSCAITYHGASPAIKETFPEVENFVRLHRADGMMNHYKENGEVVSYHETKSFYADSSFFSIFSFPLIAGDKSQVLRKPNSMLISQSAAKKYFGDENAMGKLITLRTDWQGGDYVIEGVFEDIPQNSHMRFDFLFAIENLLTNDQFKSGGWYWTNFYNYVLLKPGTNQSVLQEKLSFVIDTHLGKDLKRLNGNEKFILQPLTDIHLHSNISGEMEANGDYRIVSFLVLISIFIIGIAWLNYINLSTAKGLERAKEVGIRKVLGSNRNQLIKQFLLEALGVVGIAIAAAAIIIIIINPYFSQLTGSEVSFNLLERAGFWTIALMVICIGTFLSGLYPAFVLSSFHPVVVLKGKSMRNIYGVKLREILVVFQFTASIFLIIAALTISKQLEFMRNQNLGMNIEQKIILKAPRLITSDSYLNSIDHFKNEIASHTAISHVTTSSEVPGKDIFWTNEFRISHEPENIRRLMSILVIDEDFIPAYQLQFLAGRNFTKEIVADYGGAVIINESALKAFGFPDPEAALNQEIIVGNGAFKKIIGVIEDFHQRSLKNTRSPIVLYNIPWSNSYYTLTLSTQDLKSTLASIEKLFEKTFPDNAFEYFFLDQQFDQQYKSEEQLWNIFMLAASLSVFIACLGLFGLSSFLIIQKTKEIAIRKILGASVTRIVTLLSKDFARLIVIAMFCATPLTWFFLQEWLQTFAYHITMPWYFFGVSGFLTLIIAFCTISFQAIRSALANPIEAIKTE